MYLHRFCFSGFRKSTIPREFASTFYIIIAGRVYSSFQIHKVGPQIDDDEPQNYWYCLFSWHELERTDNGSSHN